ncbi:hypothetical protein BP6252_06918 [Coleophoma cylindrospora]|uniref:Alpha/beta hydrolase fold-3 domain-containing protein n=1 Tax=Coleophoma cylindrospora TaxID=1849047 RepID=A0A3D8RGL9_9HELO|nr:hypothetical protein BP6252_06918 [Coleophoma cylindrospora]
MESLNYVRLKVIASTLRLAQPCPVKSPKFDDVIQVPSRDADRTIKVHVYRPSNPQANTPSPVLVNFHGSGFVLYWHGSDDYFCRLIAQKAEYTVLDVQYRLAPEYPFPAAPHDAEDVVKYVLSQPQQYDTTHLSVSGFSAGANLALVVSSLADFPKRTFRSVLAIYPPTDQATDPFTKEAPDPSGTPIPGKIASLFNQCYFGDSDPKNPLISPIFADANAFPENMLIITCACDTLAPEAEAFADKIEKEGGKERHLVRRRVPGVSHGWDKLPGIDSEGEKRRDEIYDMAIEMLKR